MACCFCIPHYRTVSAPDIGGDLIHSCNAKNHHMTGDTLPLVEIKIPPQHTMIAEPGALCYYQDGIEMVTSTSDGAHVTEPGIFRTCCIDGCKRNCAGESAQLIHFTNNNPKEARTVGFGAQTPGHVVAVDLGQMRDNILFTMNGSFMFGAKGTRIDVVRADCMQCCCGAGLCYQKLDGDGTVFIGGGGSVSKQRVKDGEMIRIDPESLLAFTTGIELATVRTGGVMTMCCGGEGSHLTTMKGDGYYWIASSPWSSQLGHALGFLPPKN